MAENEEPRGGEIRIPIEISELFVKFKGGKLTPRERGMLANWIIQQLGKDPTWDYISFVEQKYQYDEERKVQLKRLVDKAMAANVQIGMGQFTQAEQAKAERADYAKFIREQWEMAHDIAANIIIKAYEKAKERGYYDPQRQVVDIKRFVEDAVMFYIENGDRIADMEEELEHYRALSEALVEVLGAKYAYLYLAKLWTWVTVSTAVAEAYGYRIPRFVFEEVEKVLNETYRLVEEKKLKVAKEVFGINGG